MNKKPRSYVILNCSKKDDILQCAGIVAKGGVVVFPTDTVYGIGCNPYDDKAVERIFAIKGRKEDKPLPVLASNIDNIDKIVSLSESAKMLGKAFWPGALTLVVPVKSPQISDKVTAGKGSLAVRIPSNKCILSLLDRCKYLVGTSANVSGKNSMTSSEQVLSSTLDGFDALLDGGSVEKGIESTVVDLTGSKPKVIREGAIKSEEIYRVI